MLVSFAVSPIPFLDDGQRGDTNGSYTVSFCGIDDLRVQKGIPIHKIAFEYDSEEDGLFKLPTVRAQQIIECYSPMVVNADGSDYYYLPAFVPLHVEKDITWADYSVSMLFCI